MNIQQLRTIFYQQFYVKYRLFLLPAGIVVASFLILLQVVIPQFSFITELNNKMNEKSEELATLRSSLSALKGTPDAKLTSDYALSLSALPESKNMLSIFMALTTIASKSDVRVSDFSLKIGEVYEDGKKKEEKPVPQKNALGVPTLTVVAQVEADNPSSILAFSNNLYQVFPLAEIDTFSLTQGNGVFEINFFYKPFDLKQIAREELLTPMATKDQQLLQELTKWKSDM